MGLGAKNQKISYEFSWRYLNSILKTLHLKHYIASVHRGAGKLGNSVTFSKICMHSDWIEISIWNFVWRFLIYKAILTKNSMWKYWKMIGVLTKFKRIGFFIHPILLELLSNNCFFALQAVKLNKYIHIYILSIFKQFLTLVKLNFGNKKMKS